MFNENPKEETVIAMRNREIRLNREGEYQGITKTP